MCCVKWSQMDINPGWKNLTDISCIIRAEKRSRHHRWDKYLSAASSVCFPPTSVAHMTMRGISTPPTRPLLSNGERKHAPKICSGGGKKSKVLRVKQFPEYFAVWRGCKVHSLSFLLTLTRTLRLQIAQDGFWRWGGGFLVRPDWHRQNLNLTQLCLARRWKMLGPRCDARLCATKKARLKECASHYFCCVYA